MPWLYKQKNSRFWWIGDRIDGKPRYWSTKKADRKEAEKILALHVAMSSAKHVAKLTDDFYEALSGKSMPNVSLKAAMADWMTEAHGATSKSTYERYESVRDEFLLHTNATDSTPLLRDVTSADVLSFLTAIRKRRSAATVNLYRKILSSFFRRYVTNGILKTSPVATIKKFKARDGERVERRAFTTDEIKSMLAKADTDFWRYMILGGYYTGFRIGDLCTLTVGNVDFKANQITRRVGKTKKPIVVPMSQPLRELLYRIIKQLTTGAKSEFIWKEQAERYLEQRARPFSNDFYTNILAPLGLVPVRKHRTSKTKTRGRKQFKMNDVSFHCLRHTLNSQLQMTGSNKGIATDILGHMDESTNAIYTHIPLAVLKEAIDRLPGITSKD